MSEESDAIVVSETYDRIQILGFICVLLIWSNSYYVIIVFI